MFRNLKEKLQLARDLAVLELQEFLGSESPPAERRPLEMYELENRILLSATPVAALAESMDVAPTQDFAPLTPGPSATTESAASETRGTQSADSASTTVEDRQTLEVVFIDTSVEGYQQLVDDIINSDDTDRQFELVLLNQSSDGVDRISESLGKFSDVDAVHIVSHGTEGAVKLGNVWLTTDNLGGYAGELAHWSNSLSSSADILFYGCDLAGSDDGIQLLQSIATLTNSEVAASSDDTGSALLGGDWELEFAVGPVESAVAFSPQLQQSWLALLDAGSFQQGTAGYIGTQDTYLRDDQPDTPRGSDDTVFLESGTREGLLRFDNIFGTGVGQIPLGSTITSVDLTLDVSRVDVPMTISLNSMLVDWNEDTATWNSLNTSGGGIQTDDVEASSIADDADLISTTGLHTFTSAGLTSTLQAWSDGASTNYGWAILSSVADSFEFWSSEENDPSGVKPQLVVNYTPALVQLATVDEFRVNTTFTSTQETSNEDRGSTQAVAIAPNGEYVVVWSSNQTTGTDADGFGVLMQRFDASGNPIGGELQVNQNTSSDQFHASVAVDDTGRGVVVWKDADAGDVKARLFASDGTLNGGEFTANTTTPASQDNASVAMDAGGNFVVVWEGNGSGDSSGIYGQRFDAAGGLLGLEFRVNDTTTGTQSEPSVAVNSTGQFAVVWDDGDGVHARTYEADGTGGSGSQFNVDGGLTAGEPDVGIDDSGNLVVTWRETNGIFGKGVYRRAFEFDGTPLTADDVVNSQILFDQTDPSISMVGNGNYIIAWEGNGLTDASGVNYQRYDASHLKIGGETAINQTTSGTQNQVSLATLDADNFVVVWSGQGVGDNDGVLARQFHLRAPILDLDADNDSGASGSDFIATFADGGGPVVIVDSDATLIDENDTNLQSLTVKITDRQDGTDEILAADTSGTGITANFNSFSGVLTLWGMDTVEKYQQVLRTVNYDNGQDPATGLSRTITFIASDGLVDSNLGTTSLSMNQSPTANAGGPYVINEGDALNLVGSASSDPDTDPLTYEWDLDNDGNFAEAGEPTTETPTVSWATLQSFGIDDDGPSTIGLRVDDGKGGFGTATATVTVNNVAPILTTTGSGTVTAGSSYTLNLSASDPGADTISGWTINWGDGTIETIAGNPSTANHTYTTSGFTFNVLASATDEDGTYLQNELLVASSNNDRVLRYGADGDFLQAFATSDGSDYPVDTIIGPDGNLYLSGWNSNDVLRYNATTGVFIDEFVAAGSGGLNSAAGMAFGPDGHLYVASRLTSEVLRFDGSSGAFIDAFVTAGSGGLDEAEGLTFGPSGDLYVSDYNNSAVYKYDGNTGAFDSVFVTGGSGGLDKAEDLVFGPDGNLYVADDNGSSVLRYNGTTGAFIDAFVPSGSNGLTFATGVDFGPDGHLYVGSWGTDSVLRFDGSTGAFIDEYISAGSGGLGEPDYFTFIPEHQVLVTAANATPSANAGGPYAINEGNSLNLIGSLSSDLDMDPLTYAWDLDNDGNFGEPGEPATEAPTVSWATLVGFGIADDGVFTIGLQVDDGNGGTDTTTAFLTVTNVNPTANADAGTGFITNEDSAFATGSVLTNDTDPNPLDVLSVTGLDMTGAIGLVVNNNDGTFAYDPNGQFESLAAGQQTTDSFGYTLSDDDGGSSSGTVTLTIDGQNDAPSDISLDNTSVSESVSGAIVGDLSTTDVDAGDTHTYLIDDTRFEITGGQLRLKASQSLDFETEPTVDVTITSTDAQGSPLDRVFVLTVTDANDTAPVIDAAQSFDIAEDIADLTVVGTVTASDVDTTGETRQNWMITGGDPAGVFAIDAATGQITIADNSTLDFDTVPVSYALSVTTSDGTNMSAVKTVTINLVDVNDMAPIINSSQAFTIAENSANSTVVGTVTATDADTTGEPRQNWIIIAGDPAGAFAINAATGQITIADNSTLDFEAAATSYVLSVTTSDGTNTSAAETVTIDLTDVNDNTPVVNPSQSFNVSEPAANGTSLGTLTATDQDAGTTFSNWTITSGNTDGIFAINSSTGELTISDNTNLDFETSDSYTLGITVSDGLNISGMETVSISVIDQNDSTPVVGAAQAFNISETAGNGFLFGTVTATDADAATIFDNWTITAGNTDGIFSINNSTGELSVLDNTNLDLETTPSYLLSVTVSDGVNTSTVETVAVNVTNVNDNAHVGNSDIYAVVEGDTLNEAAVSGVLANDTDADGDPLSASLISGPANAASFLLNSDGSFTYQHDGTETTSDTFTYSVSDGTHSTTATVNLMIIPQNDAPVATADNYSLTEGATLNRPAFNGVLANDTDTDNAVLTASLISGPSSAAGFTLNSDGSFTYQHDGSETGSDSFTYRVSDGNGGTDVATVNLSITLQNDAPLGNSDSYTLISGTDFTVGAAGGVLANDSDAESNPLSAVLIGATSNGVVVLSPNGSFVYTPDTGFTGTDSFQYVVNDGSTNSAPVTVSLAVTVVAAPIPESPPNTPASELPDEAEADTNIETESTSESEQTATASESPTDAEMTSVPNVSADNAQVPVESLAATLASSESDDDTVFSILRLTETASLSTHGQASTTERNLTGADVTLGVTLNSLEFRSVNGLDFADENLGFLIDTAYLSQLEAVDDEILSEAVIETWVTGSAVVTGTGLSVGYIMWMIRGGYLMASLMSVLPVWQDIDPLHVLDAMVNDDDPDDESLQDMIEKAELEHDARPDANEEKTPS